ncbi:MAG TPA: hypothetical protein VNH46_04880, partial [Gemmatimonadales bacterium]|nr:hypothetical protein [Gemmatimonadales bacterium]
MTRRVAVAGALLWAVATPATAQSLAYEGGLGFTTGRYIFTTRTTSWSLTTGLALQVDRLTLRASLPVWLQNSTVVTAGGTTGIPSGGSSGGTVSDSGKSRQGRGSGRGTMVTPALAQAGPVEVPASAFTDYRAAVGDPLFGATLQLLAGSRLSLSIGGNVKAPVADTSTFGTGQWDVGGSLSLGLQLGPRTLLGLDGAWWRLGDLPDLDFSNPVSGSLSLSQLLGTGGWGGYVFGRGSTTALAGFDGPLQVGAGLSRFGGRGGVGLEAAAGLSETAPDLSLGLFWRVRI